MTIQKELRSIREQTLRGTIEKLIEEHEPLLRVTRDESGKSLIVEPIGDKARLRVTIEEINVAAAG